MARQIHLPTFGWFSLMLLMLAGNSFEIYQTHATGSLPGLGYTSGAIGLAAGLITFFRGSEPKARRVYDERGLLLLSAGVGLARHLIWLAYFFGTMMAETVILVGSIFYFALLLSTALGLLHVLCHEEGERGRSENVRAPERTTTERRWSWLWYWGSILTYYQLLIAGSIAAYYVDIRSAVYLVQIASVFCWWVIGCETGNRLAESVFLRSTGSDWISVGPLFLTKDFRVSQWLFVTMTAYLPLFGSVITLISTIVAAFNQVGYTAWLAWMLVPGMIPLVLWFGGHLVVDILFGLWKLLRLLVRWSCGSCSAIGDRFCPRQEQAVP